jgi:tetratricopeptide (TPR) repeat protein
MISHLCRLIFFHTHPLPTQQQRPTHTRQINDVLEFHQLQVQQKLFLDFPSQRTLPRPLMSSSQNKLPSLQRLPLEKVPHAIDFIGTGTFQVSQLDVLQKRSIELIKTTESNLSARGLHHRSKDYFTKDVRASTAVIQQALLQGVRDPKNNNKSSVYLKSQYFQRALGFERLGEIDRAIEDYGRCLTIDPQCAAAYFNRGGLYYSQGKLDLATIDYDKAIELEPSKQIYHTNRALIYRRRGLFTEATSDTLISKNISNNSHHHHHRSLLRSNDSFAIHSELKKQISIIANDEDPVITFLKKSFTEREESGEIRYVIEFLKSIKFFHGIASEPNVMKNCAKKVRLIKYEKDSVIFNEGDPGKSFYVILDGEVSIVKMMKLFDSEKIKTEILIKLFRGQTFGETALDHEAGVRTAGAIASQSSHLLVMDVDDYKRIFAHYRLQLRNDIR